MVVIVCTLFFSWTSEALRDLLGVDNRFILLSEENKWTVFDVDTCLGGGVAMNYELSPFMTATFLLWSSAFILVPFIEIPPSNRALFTGRTQT